MKKIVIGLACFFAFEMQALEYEKQYENDYIGVARVKIMPHEEIDFHRDTTPQIVIALKGGTITRLEADGSITPVEFPTGIAVYRKPDAEGQLHKSINKSTEAVELIVIQLKSSN